MATRKPKDLSIALLRGINVGGKNKIPMRELAPMFVVAGASEVKTYIQSGNVVFRASAAKARRMGPAIEDAIRERWGYRTPVVTRSAEDLAKVVRTNPYVRAGVDPKLLHVAFLADAPSRGAIARLDPDRSPPDEFTVRGAEVYLHCPNGVARSKLTNAYLDATLQTTSTARNWRTVLALLELVRTG